MYPTMPHAAPSLAPFPMVPTLAESEQELTIEVLHTPQQRQEIAHLRKYADFRSEYEVDPSMAAVDPVKDAIGLVMGFYLGGEAIATMRFIPTGHGVTLTERWWGPFVTQPQLLGNRSWEVGRLVMAPEHRQLGVLPQCMTMALEQLLALADVDHMHATCHMAMTRLYRRFGFGIHAKRLHGDKDCALIHGRVEDVARCLKVPMRQAPAAVSPAQMLVLQ